MDGAPLEALLARVADGDREALGELHERGRALVHGLALRILRDAADADEVVLEVFFQVWRKARDYDPATGRPAAWLSMIAKSRALDKLRSRRSRARHEDPLSETVEVTSRQPSPETEAGWAENASKVRAALARLPNEQREPLELAYYQGFTQSELASKLGEPLGTIKTRMRAGLKRLRTEMAPA